MNIQADLCRTWSETPKTGFLASQLLCNCLIAAVSGRQKRSLVDYGDEMTTVETGDICAPADGADVDSGSRRMQTMRQLNKSKTYLSRTVCLTPSGVISLTPICKLRKHRHFGKYVTNFAYAVLSINVTLW